MRLRLGNGLIALIALTILLIPSIFVVPSLIGRIVLGLPFLLFSPGYTLILALFPKKEQISSIERVALSFGLSIATVPLIGLILNYTPLGITVYSTLFSVAGFIFVLSIIAWFRLRSLDKTDRFSINIYIKFTPWGENKLDKILSIILIIAVAASIGVLIYAIAAPKVGEKFTELYVIGLNGQAGNYPTEIPVGEEASVILGAVNHEHESIDYIVTIVVNGSTYGEEYEFSLDNDESWEQVVSFSADSVGDNQKVEFLLYKKGQTDVYLSVHLWVDVGQTGIQYIK